MLRIFDPYEWQIRFLCKGNVLEVGCGIGRNLRPISRRAVGVDHNSRAIEICVERNLVAYDTEAFSAANFNAESFDTILLAHVLEHIDLEVETSILETYLPLLKDGGRIVLICPQEKGYASDETHIRWVDDVAMLRTLENLGCTKIKNTSFPFPRWVGKYFIYNQFVVHGELSRN